ncbi:MAG TPA: AAA family ATPase [Solirubrobacteraceae bacterium]
MLFGRSTECGHLEALLDAAASGPVGCILEGTPGIGKSTVWRACLDAARVRGLRVLETAPSEPESVLAFSGLSDLFERLPDGVIDALPEVQAHGLKAALFQGEVPEGVQAGQTLPRAVLSVLRELAATGPILLAIDDEQWLDPASARVLAFVLCRLRHESIAVVLARRSGPRGTLAFELDRRFGGRGMETVPLEPLPMRTLKLLLEERLKRTITRPVLRRIYQASGGNPLYALAIALELETRHSSGDRAGELPVPRTLSDAIELRLEHLDPRANAAMLAIAVLSHPTLAMLQAAIPDFALSDLESAERAGVIEILGGRVRFTHPLLASTHYGQMPVSRRRELHRRLAMVLDDQEERAQHSALGAEAPNRAIADALESAAAVAARRGAPESAARLLEDAARLTPIDQEAARSERMIAAAVHRFSSGEVSRARETLEDEMHDLESGPLRARAQIELALIRSDEPMAAVELLEGALADAGDDDALRVEIQFELTAVAAEAGRLGGARAHAESALEVAERLRDPELVAKALGGVVVTHVATGERIPHDLMARLSEMPDSTATGVYHQASTSGAMALYWAGDIDRARPLLERAVQRALTRGEEWDQLGLLLVLAQLEWEAGNPELAEQHRHEAEEALGEYEEGLLWLVTLDARFALDRGDVATARTKAEQGLAQAEQKRTFQHRGRLIQLLASLELLSGQPERAHNRLEQLRKDLLANGYGPAGLTRSAVWSDDIEALIAMGGLDEAEKLLAELRDRARAAESSHMRALAARCEGVLLAARGDLAAAIEAMDRALAEHSRSRRPFEHGRTLVEKGSIERRAKHKAAAKQTLEEALAMFEPLGAQLWVSRARDELSRIGLRQSRAAEGLTPAQRRVGELVAEGLTNPEIARQLHMSLRTVESHLSRVYREHGVSSRSQLVAALVASSSPGA